LSYRGSLCSAGNLSKVEDGREIGAGGIRLLGWSR
jgi:hypothetical protein